MAYETLVNSSIAEQKPAPQKPNYTPSKSLKKALKAVRKFFRKSAAARSHQKLVNESSALDSTTQQPAQLTAECPSAEECENYANELREAIDAAQRAQSASTD